MFNAANLIQKLASSRRSKKEEPDKQGLSGSDETFDHFTTS